MECRKPQKRKNLRLLILTTNLSKPGHDVAGLFFCLASAEGAGLLFCHAAMHPYTSVYSEFCAVHATIPHMPQNSAQGFTGAFSAICHVSPLLYGGASSYTAPPAPRWTPGHCADQHSRPIIIRYIMVQHTADHASPAMSRYFPRPAACDLAPGQQSRRGGRRGTIDGSRRNSFRAFAR